MNCRSHILTRTQTTALTKGGSPPVLRLAVDSYEVTAAKGAFASLFAKKPVQPSTTSKPSVLVLIFSHANGMCKETWRPLIRRLLNSPSLLQLYKHIYVHAWDSRMAGDSADLNKDLLTDPVTKKPLERFLWKNNGEDARFIADWARAEAVKKAPGCSAVSIKVVAVGHSFGGNASLRVEETAPGMFDQIIVFEPIVWSDAMLEQMWGTADEDEIAKMESSPIAQGAKRRKDGFDSREQALTYCKARPFFQSWDEEVLKLYLEHGLKVDKISGKLFWKCLPAYEGAVFEGEMGREVFPKLKEIRCPVTVIAGGKSEFASQSFQPHGLTREQLIFRELQQGTYKLLEDVGHMMGVEKPQLLASEVEQAIIRTAPLPNDNDSRNNNTSSSNKAKL